MPKKYTYERVKEIFEENGYELLDKEYIGSKAKMTCRDKEGYKYYHNLAGFIDNDMPYRYSKTNIHTIYNINKYMEINKISSKLNSSKYISTDSILSFTCGKCENEFTVSWHHFTGANQCYCNDCRKYHNEARKRTIEDIKLMFTERNLVPLFSRIKNLPEINHKTPLLCKDKDGYYGELPYNRFQTASTFSIVDKCNKYSIKNINTYFRLNNRKVRVIKNQEYMGSDQILSFICSTCGDIFKSTWDYIRNNYAENCQNCSSTKSTLEIKAEDVLQTYEIEYIREYTFDSCGNKRVLPFDFYIPKLNICIECDGQQHFEPITFGGCSHESAEKSFKAMCKNDKIKDMYCEEHNIKLIRIPYWEFKNENYIDIIKEILELDMCSAS